MPRAVYGTDIYTDDSSVCTAAVHAGLISTTTGGPVTVEIRPDSARYVGSTRHGIASRDWMDVWPASFVFVWGEGLASRAPAVQISGKTTAESWPAGRTVTVVCPGRFELHSVHGTDIYTADSYICSAAVHAGVLRHEAGGPATIRLLPAQGEFHGSTRNGLTSFSTNTWLAQSFRFIDTPPDVPPPPKWDTPNLTGPRRPQ